MNELTVLRNIGKARKENNHNTFKRVKTLIIPPEATDRLDAEHWHFVVKRGFRDAFDILKTTKIQNGKIVESWTQGPIIRFKEGDILHSKCGQFCVQVKFYNDMGWDLALNDLDEGTIVYKIYSKEADEKFVYVEEKTTTQYGFLNVIINGL
ncbi:MAG: hypothetical protein ACK5MF_15405 [Vibrio sp.]|uniref:hypothetical protein n=1 Tax=Vibrio sp. TaxID=678 RepID=UPI003A86D3F7